MNEGATQPYGLTLDRFLDHAAKWHGRTEIVTGGAEASVRTDYATLRTASNGLSGALLSLGLGQGDRLTTLAWNTQAHLEFWYAAMGVGIVCHTLNPRLSSEHLAGMIHRAGDRVLAVSAGLESLAGEIVERCSEIEHVIILDEPVAGPSAPIRGNAQVWRQTDLLRERGEAAEWGHFDENIAAGLCFTSGTTGAPKGVTYTHRSNYLLTVHSLQPDVLNLRAEDSVLVAVPMFHANGWSLPFAGPAVGAKLVLPGRHNDGASLVRLINEEQVTVALGVATVWLELVGHLDRTGDEVPSLQRLLLGGSPLPRALKERLEQRLGVVVQTGWGMTELSPLGTVMPATETHRPASQSGRPPIGVDLLVVDAAGKPLVPQRGQEGRLRVRGASAVERYFGEDAPATDDAGWFDTGDLAVIGEDGYLSITGRTKDLIKSGGEWINSAEIEAIAGELPEVALAAVIGRAHPKWGERPLLVIEERNGRSISDDRMLDALKQRVARWWLPDAIVRVPAMPLALTGKIDKVRLRREFG